MCLTPARAAAAMKLRCSSRRNSDSAADTMKSRSTPARARSAAAPSAYVATATSLPGISGAREASRTMSRGCRSASWRATRPPTAPVEPVIARVMWRRTGSLAFRFPTAQGCTDWSQTAGKCRESMRLGTKPQRIAAAVRQARARPAPARTSPAPRRARPRGPSRRRCRSRRTAGPSRRRPRRSAARCPTRRRRRRPSSRPGRRSGPAVHALDLGDQRDRGGGGRAADGGGRVQGLGQLERGGRELGVLGGVHDAGDVGGQVHDVRQVQHERRLGHVHRRSSAARARRRPSGRRTRAPRGPSTTGPGSRRARGRARRRRSGGWCRPAPAR